MYRIIRKGELPVSRWSGGTTTQLAIWPEGAVYAERNFVWRVSSARVETQESEFTSLPGVARTIPIPSRYRSLLGRRPTPRPASRSGYSTNTSTTSEAAFSAVCAFRSARREPSGSRTSSSMPSSRRSGCCFSSIGRALRKLRNRHPLRNRPLRRRKEGRHRRRLERNQKRNKSWKG